MRVLIVFGTTEGHTRAIAQFVARCVRELGHRATVNEAGPDASHPDPAAYDVVFLAASLHVGRFQAPLVHYAHEQHKALAARPSAFISVSLACAGACPDDWAGLEECLARFRQETLWTPAETHHAAGAILYSQYDFFKRLALKHIVEKRGRKTITSRDHDLTDYEALRAFVAGFIAENTSRAAPAVAEGSTPT